MLLLNLFFNREISSIECTGVTLCFSFRFGINNKFQKSSKSLTSLILKLFLIPLLNPLFLSLEKDALFFFIFYNNSVLISFAFNLNKICFESSVGN